MKIIIKIIVENCVSCWLLFIWNAHSLAHLLTEMFLFCSSTSTGTGTRTHTMILRSVHVSLQFYSNKRIFDYVRLKINSSLRCCLFFFLSHIRIRIRFLHCFVVRLFLTFVSSAMWWMERVKRPVLCTFTVHPSVPCCFCFRRCCFCSCSKLFGRFKCVRCAHTHTYISYCPFNNVCLYFEIGSQTLQQRVTQTNAWGNAFRCVSLTMSKSPVFRCCRVAQYSM